jgi:hypothetical protein
MILALPRPTNPSFDPVQAVRRRRQLRRAAGALRATWWICVSLALASVALLGLLTLK